MAEGTDRIALVSDIHGNMPAFEAVLADINRRGIGRVFCLGDLVGKGPHGDRVVDLCRARCERIVRGNWDDGIVAAKAEESTVGRWQRARLGPERLAFLAALSNTVDLRLSGRQVRLLHASPGGVYQRVPQDSPKETLLTMFASTAFTGADFMPDTVGYGDIHTPFLRSFYADGRILFNVGSVGNPLDLPLACYAILEGAVGENGVAPLSIQIVRVPYDIERAIDDAAAEGMPELDAYANELRTARYRGRG